MLVLLERQGLIERQPHPTDRRARSVTLTRRGRSTLHKLWRRTEPLRGAMIDALTLDESVQLLNGLRRLTAAMHEFHSPSKRKRPSVGAVS
jgi:DNA-binding MarR family transcriptional regulator